MIIASVFDFNYYSIKFYLFNAFEELEECGDKKNAILLNLGISFCGKITQRTISSKSISQIILGERLTDGLIHVQTFLLGLRQNDAFPPPPPPMQCSRYASTSFSTQSTLLEGDEDSRNRLYKNKK